VKVKAGDYVDVNVGSHGLRVGAVADHHGADGQLYTRVSVEPSLTILANTAVSSVRLLKPGSVATPWKQTTEAAIDQNFVVLDSLNRQIRNGQWVLLRSGNELQALVVNANDDVTRTLIPARTITFTPSSGTSTNVSVPAVTVLVSKLTLSATIATPIKNASPHVEVHHGFTDGGVVTVEALTELGANDPLAVATPVFQPRDAAAPGELALEDRDNRGLERPGTIGFASGAVTVQGGAWPEPLVPPVNVYGNVVAVSRGETVRPEFLGSGDSSLANQSFVLKKSPLTYLPAPSESTPSRLTSSLSVDVDGVRWSEVPSFYNRSSGDEIYVVRQNDKGESVVTFGDGINGRRLSTGAAVVAHYRQGAGAAMPPAGSIAQIGKPVAGLKSVRSPVAPYGGADGEPAASLRKYAPRSALLLGRAVSLADIEAAAASFSGVRAASAEWRWSADLQVPAAHVWYLADGDLTELIRTQLRSLTVPDMPIQVERAQEYSAYLSIQLEHDERRFEDDVLRAVRTALTDVEGGLLPPERLGIGKPLFRSRIFEFVLDVAGVTGVTSLNYQFVPFESYGVQPPAGRYFDFDNHLYLNGRLA
jgi:hypothetical protein